MFHTNLQPYLGKIDDMVVVSRIGMDNVDTKRRPRSNEIDYRCAQVGVFLAQP
jgi:hypothetical protein